MQLFFSLLKKYSFITIASFLYALGLTLFLEPNRIVPGGVTGIAMLLRGLSGIATGTWYLLLNIPLLLFGLFQFGLRFSIAGLYSTLMISIFANVIPVFLTGFPQVDLLAGTVAGGILCGLGLGIVFRQHTTTGGLDILVKYLRKRFPYIKTGMLFFIFDVIIILVYASVLGTINLIIYSCLVVYLSSKTMDTVLYGMDSAELIYIISNQSQEVARQLLYELGVGVTNLQAKGGFSAGDKQVILCAVKKRFTPEVEEIVKNIDQSAFLIISSASEIYGEGFKDFFIEKI